MIGQSVTFDGHLLNDLFCIGVVEVGMPSFDVDSERRATGDGSRFRSLRIGEVEITVPLVVKDSCGKTAEEALSALVSWLHVDEPKVLQLSNDLGKWRYAVPNNAPSVKDYEWNDVIAVEFLQLDPALYGEEKSVTVPSGGSASVMVGGDYPTTPTISSDAAVRDSSTRQWGIQLDDGEFVHVSIGVSTASTVDVDCGARTCAVNGSTTIPTITSDWLVLEPGAHTFANDLGTGACTVTWIERWHR